VLTGIHHVQITIPRGAEAEGREFLCRFLGLPEIDKPVGLRDWGGFWLLVGDRQVHVGVEAGVERRATKAHIAYEFRDLDGWRSRLEKAGIAVSNGIPISGYRRFEFRDPFGNRVEFLERETG
jgi:catechol 2,3-dioxygenase-like lactoylglutathione lyase family enzyme